MVKLTFCKVKSTIKIPDLSISSVLKTKSRHLPRGYQLCVHESPTHPCLMKPVLTGISATEIYGPARLSPVPGAICGAVSGSGRILWVTGTQWRVWRSSRNKQDMVILVRLRPLLLWFPWHTRWFPSQPSEHSWLCGLVHEHPGSGKKGNWMCKLVASLGGPGEWRFLSKLIARK